MRIDSNQERVNSIEENINESTIRMKKEILANEISRLLKNDSVGLLDQILSHPLSIDYFNVYLSLPIFGQRVLCHRYTRQFDFDPPLLSINQTQAKQWIINSRLKTYVDSDIYIESLLALLLIQPNDTAEVFFKESRDESQSSIFSTVTDVRQFHQFLQTTTGIKGWNFFTDSLRLLRPTTQNDLSTRIDMTFSSFVDKYYSQHSGFRSLNTCYDRFSGDNRQKHTIKWLELTIDAMRQLRSYWLPRYRNQISSRLRSKRKQTVIESISNDSNQETHASTENLDHISHRESTKNERKFVKYTLGNMSYIDYNPGEYISIQSSDDDHESIDLNESNISVNEANETKLETTAPPSLNQSIEDYATDANIELFYRILISDSLAGSPFSDYLSQIVPREEIDLYQLYMHFVRDAEILFSIPYGRFRERVMKRFIYNYLSVSTSVNIDESLFDNNEEERMALIKQLMTNDTHDNPLLWKYQLKITKFLIPYFLDYIKYDRFSSLIQNSDLSTKSILDYFRQHFPSINFKALSKNQPDMKESNFKEINFNEIDFIRRSNLPICDELLPSVPENRYNTTEKMINTDEHCEIQPGERFPPLTEYELEEELRRLCPNIEWNDVKTVPNESFHVPSTSNQTDTNIYTEGIQLNPIETYADEIMQSAHKIVEIDQFVSNLMDDSLALYQTINSYDSSQTPPESSPLSPVFEEILLTDSSPTITSPRLFINNNAYESSDSKTKILSLTGSYFINRPKNKTFYSNLMQANFSHESIRFAQKDASNDAKNIFYNEKLPSRPNNHSQELLQLFSHQISNHEWPLDEYIGSKGQRAWRALKLAADICNLDHNLTLNYHKNLDWISSDNDLGSFNERIYLIVRDFYQRLNRIHFDI